MTKQVKIYAGSDTLEKWRRICRRFSSNTAAFAVVVEHYFNQEKNKMDTIYSSPDSYGETVYCAENKIAEVEESLADPAVFGPDFERGDWEPWELVAENIYRDQSGNYAKFSDNLGYFERISKFTQWDPRED